VRTKFPLADQHLINLEKTFKKYDKNSDGMLDVDEMKSMLKDIDSKMTNLPAVSPFLYKVTKLQVA
jgi:NADH dehydrogenase